MSSVASTSCDSVLLVKLKDPEKYSDLELLCQGQAFKVHKVIVCGQSPVLSAACDGGFKESVTNVIDINEFNPRTVRRMVDFIYTGEYNDDLGRGLEDVRNKDSENGLSNPIIDSSSATPGNDDAAKEDLSSLLAFKSAPAAIKAIMLDHVHVNAIADYYDIPRLKHLANTKIRSTLEAAWSAEGFSEVVKEVFDWTSDIKLQSIMAEATVKHIGELIGLDDFTSLELMSGFTAEIMRNMLSAHQDTQSQLRETKISLHRMEEELSRNKSLFNEKSARVERIIENVNNCHDILTNTKCCRICAVKFTCHIECQVGSKPPKYTLRCSKCYTEHHAAYQFT